ncbi:hypothetical protein BC829DRAFT_283372 [Chytridium lagenaria]|nr:hypothetical protein BC829DRAFT_283372 [Chytridium lagenaria]
MSVPCIFLMEVMVRRPPSCWTIIRFRVSLRKTFSLFSATTVARPSAGSSLVPPRSGATWHIDPFFTSAWNALVSGRKRWCLYPPTMVPPGIIPDRGSRSGFDAPSALHWFTEVYPMIPVEYRPLEIIQEPGDVIFVPAGWWHAVLNLDEVNVAVTQISCTLTEFCQ